MKIGRSNTSKSLFPFPLKKMGSAILNKDRTFITKTKDSQEHLPKPVMRKINKIYDLHREIGGVIADYGPSLHRKLKRENVELSIAYDEEMVLVRDKLRSIRDREVSLEAISKPEEYVYTLQSQLDWFKQEALKLSSSCAAQNTRLSQLKQEISQLDNKIKILTTEIKKIASTEGKLQTATDRIESEDQYFSRRRKSDSRFENKTPLKFQLQSASKKESPSRISQIVQYMLKQNMTRPQIIDDTCKQFQRHRLHHNLLCRQLHSQIREISNRSSGTNIHLPNFSNPELMRIFFSSIESRISEIFSRPLQRSSTNRYQKYQARQHFRRGASLSISVHGEKINTAFFTATDKKAIFFNFITHPLTISSLKKIIEKRKNQEKPVEEPEEKIEIGFLQNSPYKVSHLYKPTLRSMSQGRGAIQKSLF